MFESFPDSKQQWKIINTQIKEKEKNTIFLFFGTIVSFYMIKNR